MAFPLLNTAYANTSLPVTKGIQNESSTELNKKIVTDFYQGVFQKHQVQSYSDQYLVNNYIQHNPYVADGKKPFVDYFVEYFKKNPKATSEIKRIAADGNLVWVHVHSKEHEKDLGTAVIDIFRLEKGKIVEHWDVIQNVPEQSANQNTMF